MVCQETWSNRRSLRGFDERPLSIALEAIFLVESAVRNIRQWKEF